MEGYELARACAKALSEKKAQDIVILDVHEQVRALGDAVEEKIEKEAGISPVRKEGLREGRWGVIDYGDVVVHVFNEESRLYYYLERLWDSGRNIERYED